MTIIVYTKRGCSWCVEVTDLLTRSSIPFEEREVLSNTDYYAELVQKSGQRLTPTLDIDGEIYPDSDVTQMRHILAEKGLTLP